MKNDKIKDAQHLYFQTDLTKTEIAEQLNISRRTLHYWAKDQEWDRLKKSAKHMPALLVENCHLAIAKITGDMLAEGRTFKPITKDESVILKNVATTIKILRQGVSLNETLEIKAHFMDYVQKQNPEMAETIMPYVDSFVKSRANIQPWQFKPENLTDHGHFKIKEENIKEIHLDIEDEMHWADNPPHAEETAVETEPAPQPGPVATEAENIHEVASPNAQPQSATPTQNPIHILNNKKLNRKQRRELERRIAKQNNSRQAA